MFVFVWFFFARLFSLPFQIGRLGAAVALTKEEKKKKKKKAKIKNHAVAAQTI